MSPMRMIRRNDEPLERAFEKVMEIWDLSACEQDAVRGSTILDDPTGGRSRFNNERMELVVAIAALLSACMATIEIRLWLRRRVANVFGSTPLDDMVGSTDRLRRIRALLELEFGR